MGVIHRPHPGWASHMPVLIKALELTTGPVLELGLGYFSTPLLHTLCDAQKRRLTSYESDERYINIFRRFRSDNHVILQTDWRDVDYSGEWSVALVDQKPAEVRKESIKRLTEAIFVVIHDSNDPIYDYQSIYPLFKYRWTYDYLQHTTVLSNKDDVKDIFRNSIN